jgi:hypothetical protein
VCSHATILEKRKEATDGRMPQLVRKGKTDRRLWQAPVFWSTRYESVAVTPPILGGWSNAGAPPGAEATFAGAPSDA